MERQNRKPNRYILIAKPKNVTDINLITKKTGELDLSKLILIDVPNEFEIEEKNQTDIPKKKTRKVKSPKKYEEKSKRILALIDTFVFNHSSKENVKELREYLNQNLHYQIPENFDFAIIYRSSKKNISTDKMTKFKFLDPIYGDNTYIVSWLKDIAQLEYENRNYDKETASAIMRKDSTWNTIYKEFIQKDVYSKGSMVDTFSTWVDTRGYVSKMEKKKQQDDFEKMWNDIVKDGEFTNTNFLTLSKYPLSIIMYTCRRYSNNPNAWEILQRKLTSYKEVRGFLLHRYHFKLQELILSLEQELRNTKLTEEQQKQLHLVSDFQNLYEACRYSKYSLLELRQLNCLPNEIMRYGEEVFLKLNENIEEKKEQDDVVYTEIVFTQNNEKKKLCTYLEHEEEQMYPEEMQPMYTDIDMIEGMQLRKKL